MTSSNGSPAPSIRSSMNSQAMAAGFALVAAGALVGMCGLGIAGRALLISVRRWWYEQGDPTGALVQRAIASAGAGQSVRRDSQHRTPAASRAR